MPKPPSTPPAAPLTNEEIVELRELLAERRASKELMRRMVEQHGTSAGMLTKMVDPYGKDFRA